MIASPSTPVVFLLAVNACLLIVAWIVYASLLAAALRNVRLLEDALAAGEGGEGARTPSASGSSPCTTGAAPGSLSVVVTARDEARTIGETVARLLDQRYEALQVIVVDDRSSDGTGEILRGLSNDASGRERLEVVSNTVLPDGWLGKCHACSLGAARARGAWILFMDGDVVLAEKDLLARIVELAERSRLDHVAVLPDLRPMPRLQSAIVSAFGQIFLLATRTYEMARDLPRGGVGVGAFNLIRRSAYERIGGHERIKMDPGDDLKLGMLLKESGARQRLFEGLDLVKCRWQYGALNVIRGFEKNGFSGCDYSILKLVGFSMVALWMALGPLVGALGVIAAYLSSPERAAIVIGSAALVFQFLLLLFGFAAARRRGYSENPLVAAILYPLGLTLVVVAMWNSAIRTLIRGGITWRGTFYPLEALRRGLVRRGVRRRQTE